MKFQVLKILISLPLLIVCYTDVNTIEDCYNCINGQGKIVCRDERLERIAFCCSPGENSRGCVRRDFCSTQALSLSM